MPETEDEKDLAETVRSGYRNKKWFNVFLYSAFTLNLLVTLF
jgi:hypothetical protein